MRRRRHSVPEAPLQDGGLVLGIQTNVASLLAQRNLGSSQVAAGAAFARLSSGYRITGAKDDAAGLAIAESMRSQARSMVVAERNTQDGISMVQTAEGALGELSGMVLRMRELATQAANGALGDSDRAFVQAEYAKLQDECRRVLDTTKFNGKKLLAATSSSSAGEPTEVYTVGTPENNVYHPGVFHQHAGTDHLHDSPYGGAIMWNPATNPLFVHGTGSSVAVTTVESFQVGIANTASDRIDVNFDRPDLSTLLGSIAMGAPSATVGANTVVRFFDGTYGNAEATNAASYVGITNPITAGKLDAASFNDPSANVVARSAVFDSSGSTGPALPPSDVSTAAGARAALDDLDAALQAISGKRAYFGAMLNRFDSVVSNLQTQRLNTKAAESRIRDVDVAEEAASQARAQVLMQGGASVLAQANQTPRESLSLLQKAA